MIRIFDDGLPLSHPRHRFAQVIRPVGAGAPLKVTFYEGGLPFPDLSETTHDEAEAIALAEKWINLESNP